MSTVLRSVLILLLVLLPLRGWAQVSMAATACDGPVAIAPAAHSADHDAMQAMEHCATETGSACTDHAHAHCVICQLAVGQPATFVLRLTQAAPFSCPWDSGQVGYIYVTFERARQEHGWKVMTKARRAKLIECLQDEVKAYDDYLTGQVYGYVLTNDNGDTIDSLWGIYDVEYARVAARNAAAHYAKEQ